MALSIFLKASPFPSVALNLDDTRQGGFSLPQSTPPLPFASGRFWPSKWLQNQVRRRGGDA